MSPIRGSRTAWRDIALVSDHFRRPDLRHVCHQSAVPDTRSSTRSTCSARDATKRSRMGGVGRSKITKKATWRASCVFYFVYSRKPSSVSTRGSDSPERIILRGSPRSGAVNCVVCGGLSSRGLCYTDDEHETNVKKTAAIDAWVSPPPRNVYIFQGIG